MNNVKSNPVSDKHDELDVFHTCEDDSEKYFFEVVGCIEEIIMREKFQDMQQQFLEKHWKKFDDKEENKLIYTDIFKEYEEGIEKYIQDCLVECLPNFDMIKFENELHNRKDELEGEIFEMLSTFTNFISFKNMFIDYKKMKEQNLDDLADHICVSKFDLTKKF
ncbi:ADP-ribosylation factor-like protein 2-binding protein [Aethina tumida]|uniref:ADP-ribosylation factor-like protein 2-binding protein n=1 Tax=Aethina tumida TaxID=116153 RepID=UPI002148314C|nr:ADP-ribosylation factor-like protein 2-binding protein [Aethina tumida]